MPRLLVTVLAVVAGTAAALAPAGATAQDGPVGIVVGVEGVARDVTGGAGPSAPGAVDTTTFTVRNDGAVPGELVLSVPVARGTEDGCTSPGERRADPDCAAPGAGDLVAQYRLVLTVAPGACGTDPDRGTEVLDALLVDVAPGAHGTGLTLAPGRAACVTSTGTFVPSTANNAAQGDGVAAVVRATLEQR